MGTYINIGNAGFASARRSEYVDKSELIAVVNSTLHTEQRFSCVSRCRRFGKSMAAKMLCAYYDHSCDSRQLFQGLSITSHPSFEENLNKYAVIYLDMTEFVARFRHEGIVDLIDTELRTDVLKEYPDVEVREADDLMGCLVKIAEATGHQFFFIIDEWDAICREFPSGTKAMDNYVSWLRRLFKGVNAYRVFAGVYMTGILPVKKYKTESALNNFVEYSMVDPRKMARYFGFTRKEVQELADRHGMNFGELEKWYDGYQIGDESSMFNPNSVMQAIDASRCRSYWANTGAYDAVATYIQMNYEGLKDNIIGMLAGGRCSVDPTGFQNDVSIVRTKDDVLTVLIHLGYLAYDWNESECYIPNKEVAGEMVNAIKTTNWKHVVSAIDESKQLLQATLSGNADAVAKGIEAAHDEHTSILSYHNENSLACVLSLAFYYAHNDYIFHREFPSGKGVADLVLIPRRNVNSPAIVVELKYNSKADAAIAQIKHRDYPAKLAEYSSNILLVGINYDKEAKTHQCCIEKWEG